MDRAVDLHGREHVAGYTGIVLLFRYGSLLDHVRGCGRESVVAV